MIVYYVDVDLVGVCIVDGVNFFVEFCKISGEDGGGNYGVLRYDDLIIVVF